MESWNDSQFCIRIQSPNFDRIILINKLLLIMRPASWDGNHDIWIIPTAQAAETYTEVAELLNSPPKHVVNLATNQETVQSADPKGVDRWRCIAKLLTMPTPWIGYRLPSGEFPYPQQRDVGYFYKGIFNPENEALSNGRRLDSRVFVDDCTIRSYLKFAYASFFKPYTGDGSGNQQDALESFYEYQADAYDTTRAALLRGREDMLQLVAAQLKYKTFSGKPVWVDIGGGTGWNIEQMGKHVDVPTFFSAVYLVDLTPSLLKIAEARFQKLGWTNVKVVCMDCRFFDLSQIGRPEEKHNTEADLITMSYSLTMILDFFPVVDMMTSLLASAGIIGVVDLYAQTKVEFMRRDYVGGFLDRHCTWLNRTFWRTWFEQDRVMFDGGRRDYLEYRFGTRMSINKRNAMLPGLRIPFYIWIGCHRHNSSADLDTSVVKTTFLPAPDGLVRPDVPLPSVYYQNHARRTYYPAELGPRKQRSLAEEALHFPDDILTSDDTVLDFTGNGATILSCLSQKPKAVHAFDSDPSNNHLLELKIAAFEALSQDKIQNLFGPEGCSDFRSILIDDLSPHMSSQAVQYWLNYGWKGWLSGNNPQPKLASISSAELNAHGDLPSIIETGPLRIHTASLEDVLSRTTPGSVSVILPGKS
ncbi:hypothetical protein PRZ48_009189 [Zasmidium cellare]|uniref:Methyltransferase domain-containing protein n=1 Tax=Zasmidium cellare TaxID=395010 RepID=A0ABR0EB26_ZASCE|nr:hypothetical protein PRZ48_009189 [Zasmidium cellare]